MNPLESSIKSAVKANQYIGNLFAKLGTGEHPRGAILTAYRNALRGMHTALNERDPLNASREVLSGLKGTIKTETLAVFTSARDFGQAEAIKQLGYYDIEVPNHPIILSSQTDSAVNAVISELDAQIATIESMLLAGLDPAYILGDDDRQGVLRPGTVLANAIFWTGALVWDAYADLLTYTQNADRFDKQAVAVLDNRTTDCCLRVHGQIQPFNQPFKLEGTPRYADELDWSPFHNHCRTSIVLYSRNYDNGITDRMRGDADYVLDQRAQGIDWNQQPANAFIE